MTQLFHVIDDCTAILCCNGVYRQVKCYERGGSLYAGWPGGFVKLYARNHTSRPKVSLLEVVNENPNVTIKEGKVIYAS